MPTHREPPDGTPSLFSPAHGGPDGVSFNTSWESNFISQMKRLREIRKMTQTDLSKEVRKFGLPFHQQTIQRIENRDRPIRLNEAFAIAACLGVTVESMTVAAVSPDQELLVAVNGIRGGTKALAIKLGDGTDDWFEECLPFIRVMEQRLVDPEGKLLAFEELDEVTRWGLAWCYRLESLWHSLQSSHRGSAIIVEGAMHSVPIRRLDEETEVDWRGVNLYAAFQFVERWCRTYRDSDLESLIQNDRLYASFPGELGPYKEPPF